MCGTTTHVCTHRQTQAETCGRGSQAQSGEDIREPAGTPFPSLPQPQRVCSRHPKSQESQSFIQWEAAPSPAWSHSRPRPQARGSTPVSLLWAGTGPLLEGGGAARARTARVSLEERARSGGQEGSGGTGRARLTPQAALPEWAQLRGRAAKEQDLDTEQVEGSRSGVRRWAGRVVPGYTADPSTGPSQAPEWGAQERGLRLPRTWPRGFGPQHVSRTGKPT